MIVAAGAAFMFATAFSSVACDNNAKCEHKGKDNCKKEDKKECSKKEGKSCCKGGAKHEAKK